ncbi:hypothetical protein DOTSEDRAFT_42258 [Dothistroma septosporum NZE10]|uniref:Uncharacterized protein n=1 Tax=Dothistroma septosporum (strain NZE10 / CBS 128990) TaxID=675120 RepID=N1PZY7_DOTSN|nr:hypothetical protein DOTSEDRAFT_42258 [Dothistroma septosporum NZE10]
MALKMHTTVLLAYEKASQAIAGCTATAEKIYKDTVEFFDALERPRRSGRFEKFLRYARLL